MGKERGEGRKHLRASPRRSFRSSKKSREAGRSSTPYRYSFPHEILPVDRNGSILVAGDLLVSHVMPDSDPIAFVKQVFPDGSYEFGWLSELISKNRGTDRVVSREAQPNMMWVKVNAP